jgi:hypothetical protein
MLVDHYHPSVVLRHKVAIVDLKTRNASMPLERIALYRKIDSESIDFSSLTRTILNATFNGMITNALGLMARARPHHRR